MGSYSMILIYKFNLVVYGCILSLASDHHDVQSEYVSRFFLHHFWQVNNFIISVKFSHILFSIFGRWTTLRPSHLTLLSYSRNPTHCHSGKTTYASPGHQERQTTTVKNITFSNPTRLKSQVKLLFSPKFSKLISLLALPCCRILCRWVTRCRLWLGYWI